MNNVSLIKFYIEADTDSIYSGVSDGTTWNGWDNVCVTRETLDAMRSNPAFNDESGITCLRGLAMVGALFSLNGFCVSIEK